MGRYGFGIHGIFGEEPNLEIRGVYIFRGKEIPQFVLKIYKIYIDERSSFI